MRDAVLALLTRGPAHGYQLKVDYERVTRNRPVNVGQIYQTLDRLQRDGLVEREDGDGGERRVMYHVTAAGRAGASPALLEAADAVPGRSDVAAKVLLAISVPGVDALRVIDAQRGALLRIVQTARREMRGRDLDMVARLGIEAELAVTEAELRWLDLCEQELRGGS